MSFYSLCKDGYVKETQGVDEGWPARSENLHLEKTVMGLHVLMNRLESLGYTTIGHGPKHPTAPRSDLQVEIDKFFATFPRLKEDQGYVDFLEYYAAVCTERPDEKLFIHIFGFDTDITLHVLYSEEPLTTDDGYFEFSQVLTRFVDPPLESSELIYAFGLSNEKRGGVYQRQIHLRNDGQIDHEPYNWYCETFLKWLENLTEAPSGF